MTRTEIPKRSRRTEEETAFLPAIGPDDLRVAITRRQLVVHYQPKIELSSDTAVGVEALVRWEHPSRGTVFPDEFIPLAERSGLVVPLDRFVLSEAARRYAGWQSQGLDLPIGVNLSPVSLLDAGLPDFLTALCEQHSIRPRGLELEVTETAVIENPTVAAATLDDLARRGFVIALDDFGTGYSSLSHLRDLPVSVVKIDKSFVLTMDRNDADARIVRGTIELARGLGKQVVAEGVENVDTARLLKLMGCDRAQGFHWSRALTAPQATDWLVQHGTQSWQQIGGPPDGTSTPADEAERQALLRQYRILDTAFDAIFDDITATAARVCGTPISAVSLVDVDRQWFKADIGLGVRETARGNSFCAHAMLEPDTVMVIPDALNDARFVDNPLVVGDPSIRFYAGAPLVTPSGVGIGSLCVIDRVPRHLSGEQLETLRELSRQVIALLEARKYLGDIEA